MKKFISTLMCCLSLVILAAPAFAQKTAEDYLKASRTRLENRDLDGALAALDKAVELKPDFAEAYFERHRLHMLKGALDPALADLNKALLIDPEMKLAYVVRGRIRMMKNDVEGALSDFDNAVGKGYRSDEVYSARANLRMMKQDYGGAISDFNTAISMNPGRIGYHLGRGAARAASGDEAGALADYTEIINRFEQKESERLAAGKGERKATPFDMTSPLIKGPESSAKVVTNSKGETVHGVTRTDTTVTIKLDTNMTPEQMEYLPNVAGAYLNRAGIYIKRGDSDAALADLNKSISIHPFFAALQMRAQEFRKRGDLNAAIADLTKAIEQQPQMAFFYVDRGAALQAIGKDAEAEKDYARAVELDPGLKLTVEKRRAETKKGGEQKSP
ncbi:MAG TPA: tetratricopeptide repeat protein [Pyrinomonadaceae bacterium]|nr:tetratricopeptide repeat protein [Pyrinomonadaceae bacterium]